MIMILCKIETDRVTLLASFYGGSAFEYRDLSKNNSNKLISLNWGLFCTGLKT